MAEKREREKSFTTCKFRVSYPHLFKPTAIREGDKPKYTITMLIDKKATDKDGKPLIDCIKRPLFNAVVRVHGPREKWPKNFEWPIQDGDSDKFEGKEGYKGCYVVRASCNAEFTRPGVYSTERDENQRWAVIEDAREFYPGCFARASVFPHVWEFMKKQGVSLILDHVQKLADGKPFSSKKSAEQAFDTLIDEDEVEDFAAEDGGEKQDEMDFR